MAQFDVFRNPRASADNPYPFVVDVQHDILDALGSRVVVPLARESIVSKPIRQLNPEFEVEGERVFFMTQELAAISRHQFGQHVGNLASHRDELLAALDLLVTGV